MLYFANHLKIQSPKYKDNLENLASMATKLLGVFCHQVARGTLEDQMIFLQVFFSIM
jgi:hypothetical protein